MTQTKGVSSAKLAAPVSGTTDIPGITATPDVLEYLHLTSAKTDLAVADDLKNNSGSETEEPRVDGTDVSVKPLPHSQTDATTVGSSGADSLACEGTSSEDNSADKIDRLRKMIDRAAGQLFTIAEVYVMMMKPSRVPLEYDWISVSAGDVATDDVSGRLRKLVSIARATFTASTAKPVVSLTLSPPIPLRLYSLPYWSNPPFLIFDIRTLWRSGLSARAPECQKLKMVG